LNRDLIARTQIFAVRTDSREINIEFSRVVFEFPKKITRTGGFPDAGFAIEKDIRRLITVDDGLQGRNILL